MLPLLAFSHLCSMQSSTHHEFHIDPPCPLGAGEGVTTDLAIAHDLYKRAAELGDPDAQADMAVRLALGLRPRTGPGSQNYGLTSSDVPAALLNYFFAAAGNDSFAQMALGYRHMYGVDVPQNCHAGLLYYNPVAEEVIEAARYPGHLPQVLIRTCEEACHLHNSLPSFPPVNRCKVAQSMQSCTSCTIDASCCYSSYGSVMPKSRHGMCTHLLWPETGSSSQRDWQQ